MDTRHSDPGNRSSLPCTLEETLADEPMVDPLNLPPPDAMEIRYWRRRLTRLKPEQLTEKTWIEFQEWTTRFETTAQLERAIDFIGFGPLGNPLKTSTPVEIPIDSLEEPAAAEERSEIHAAPLPPLSYSAALQYLPDGIDEELLLNGCFGHTPVRIATALEAAKVPENAISSILANRGSRLRALEMYRDSNVQPYYYRPPKRRVLAWTSPTRRHVRVGFKHHYNQHRRELQDRGEQPQMPSLPFIQKGKFKDSARGRRARQPLTKAVLASMNKDEAEDRHYDELLLTIVQEARIWFAELNLTCFPLCKPTDSAHEVVDTYGPAMRSRLRGTAQLRYKGVLQHWRLFSRVVEAALERGGLDVPLVLAFIKQTRSMGKKVADCLRWAAQAFGCPDLEAIAAHKILAAKYAHSLTVTARRTIKHAIWVPDEVIRVLMDQCQSDHGLLASRAMFFLIIALGGIRFADAQHIVDIRVLDGKNVAILTATRFKCSSGAEEETITIPLRDYRGRSMYWALMQLAAQKGKTFLLADPQVVPSGDFC